MLSLKIEEKNKKDSMNKKKSIHWFLDCNYVDNVRET